MAHHTFTHGKSKRGDPSGLSLYELRNSTQKIKKKTTPGLTTPEIETVMLYKGTQIKFIRLFVSLYLYLHFE